MEKNKPSQDMSDDDLIAQYINGSPNAIEILINKYKKRIYTYIYFTVKNRDLTEDIFQDTFVKVINSLKEGKYADSGKFVSWVTRIAHNLIIDYYRKEKNLNTVSKDNYEGFDLFNNAKLVGKNVEENIIREQIQKEVKQLIEELPDDQKQVIVLRHFGNLSFKEIAEDTGVSINTALGRMRYALINLRKLIEKKKLIFTID